MTSYCRSPGAAGQLASSSHTVSCGLKPSDFFSENASGFMTVFVSAMYTSVRRFSARDASSGSRRMFVSTVSYTIRAWSSFGAIMYISPPYSPSR